jgi:hypothetical protein
MAFDMPKKRYSYKQAMKHGVWSSRKPLETVEIMIMTIAL